MSPDSSPSIAGDTAHSRRRRSSELVPRHRTLDGFVKAVAQGDGIALIELDAFATLVVRTDNSIYRITILTPHRGGAGRRLLPSAHTRLSERVEWRRQLLEARVDRCRPAPGIHAGDQWIITSHVRTIGVEPSPTGRPC